MIIGLNTFIMKPITAKKPSYRSIMNAATIRTMPLAVTVLNISLFI